MTLDEIEKLAVEWTDEYQSSLSVGELSNVLARAVLAMLPVVRAALAHESARRECQRTGRHHGMLVLASETLEDAIDTFTATSASEGE
jgi:hypothetical protein